MPESSSEKRKKKVVQTSKLVLSVLQNVARRRTAGEDIDDQAIIDAHPDLQPELGQHLADLDKTKTTRDLGDESTSAHGKFEDFKRSMIDEVLAEQKAIPHEIGHYQIKRVIASGGMGTVFEAEQHKPKRTVALKVIRAGLAGPRMLQRFHQEAELLGRLQHPGIAQIYEAGTAEGADGVQPFFAMELIRGISLRRYADDHELSTRDRLELMADVCDAIQHAHQKGIIHRDLKPGNILVDDSGQPKIVDFGVARLTDADLQVTTIQTDVGQLIGTLSYMSPEQVAADPDNLDTRSDIYSLGVVAYELLAGQFPFDFTKKMIHEVVKIIQEDDPTPLSKVNKVFRGDVETILAKALAKDKARRYQSAAEMASDIRHYLRDEPISARPPSATYQISKFAKRNKALVTGVIAVFVVLIGGVVMSTSLYLTAEAARTDADQRADELEQVTKFQSSMLSEIDAEQMGRGIFADLRDGIREALEAKKTSAEVIERSLASLDTLLTGVNPTNLALKIVDRHVLSRAVETIKKDFADQPLVRATLEQAVANTYEKMGLYNPALPLHQGALTTWRHALRDEHPDMVGALNNIANVHWKQGRYAEAERLYREALAMARKLLGDEHHYVASSLNNLANSLDDQGKYAEAERLYRQALAMRRKLFGEDHPGVALVLNNLASALDHQGKYVEAERLNRQALAMRRKLLGDEHSDVAQSLNSLAVTLCQLDKYTEAEQCQREALGMARKLLGDEHPDVALSLNNLAHALLSLGKYAEAEKCQREALAIQRKLLGDEHPRVAAGLNNLALVLKSQGKYADAEELFNDALDMRRKLLGDEHPDVVNSLNGLANALFKRGKFADAEKLYREALDIRRKFLGDEHRDVATSLGSLAVVLNAQGKFEQARPVVAELLANGRKLAEKPDASTDDLNSYARDLLTIEPADLRDPNAALPVAQKAVEKSTGKDPITMDTLALAQQMTGNIDAAVETEKAAIALLSPGPSSGRTELETHLAKYLLEQRSYAEAEPLLLALHEQLDGNSESSAEQKHQSIDRIIKLYDAWRTSEPGVGHDAKAAEWRAKLEER